MLIASGITALGKTVLLVVAITFILWSLYTAMVVPKRRPGFPKRLDVYILLSALLFAAQMGAVIWVTGTQEVEKETTEAVGTTPEAPGGETTPPEEMPEGTGDPGAGAAVFTSAGCGSCHTLAAAGSTGAVGPNLDETMPNVALVVDRVTNGKGGMPAFADQLSEQEIADVAAYVADAAGA